MLIRASLTWRLSHNPIGLDDIKLLNLLDKNKNSAHEKCTL